MTKFITIIATILVTFYCSTNSTHCPAAAGLNPSNGLRRNDKTGNGSRILYSEDCAIQTFDGRPILKSANINGVLNEPKNDY